MARRYSNISDRRAKTEHLQATSNQFYTFGGVTLDVAAMCGAAAPAQSCAAVQKRHICMSQSQAGVWPNWPVCATRRIEACSRWSIGKHPPLYANVRGGGGGVLIVRMEGACREWWQVYQNNICVCVHYVIIKCAREATSSDASTLASVHKSFHRPRAAGR